MFVQDVPFQRFLAASARLRQVFVFVQDVPSQRFLAARLRAWISAEAELVSVGKDVLGEVVACRLRNSGEIVVGRCWLQEGVSWMLVARKSSACDCVASCKKE